MIIVDEILKLITRKHKGGGRLAWRRGDLLPRTFSAAGKSAARRA